jgi:UDP-N-acetylmuramate dehydrogenase
MLKIDENVSLKDYSAMKLGGNTRYFTEVSGEEELAEAIMWAQEKQLRVRVIGEGYNIVFTDEGYDGLLIRNVIKGFAVTEENETSTTIKIGAGEKWDEIVSRVVQMNLSGIEALSFIPSAVGAAPIQNIGAYGQELSQTLVSACIYNLDDHISTTVEASNLKLGYRTSRLKHVAQQTEVITCITLKLSKKPTLTRPLYSDIEKYFEEHDLHDPTPANIREAVIAVRRAKLADPKEHPNNGSFFANPLINPPQQAELIQKYPELENWQSKIFGTKSQAFWPTKDGKIKVAAGMLLEHAGLVDYHDEKTGMATWKTQGLVLVNEHAKTANDLFSFRDYIINTIKDRYGITLIQEPETIV